MKIKGLLFMLALVLGFQVQQAIASVATTNGIEPVMAEEFTSAADADYAKVIKKEKKGLGKLVSWVKSKGQKLIKKLAQIGGFGDPVDRWFWFWIIGWGAGLVFSIIGTAAFFSGGWILWTLSSLLWLAGSVCLIIWLIKKFA